LSLKVTLTIALNHTIVPARRHDSSRKFSGSTLRLQRELSGSSSVSIEARQAHVHHAAYTLGTRHCTVAVIAALAQACSVCPDEVRPETNGIQKTSIQNPMPPRRNPLSAFEQ